MADRIGKPVSQRQLRVGEMVKQSLGMIFLKNEAKLPNLETNKITVTEVKMSQDLKIAKAFVLPLGGENADEAVNILKEFSFLIRFKAEPSSYQSICDLLYEWFRCIKSFDPSECSNSIKICFPGENSSKFLKLIKSSSWNKS